MIVGKARAYPKETPFRCSTQGQAPGLVHKAGMACQGQTYYKNTLAY